MPKTSKAMLVMAVFTAMLSAGVLSSVAAQGEDGPLQGTSTSVEVTTGSTGEEDPELPTTTGEVTPPDVTDAQMASLRRQVVGYRRQTCYWQRYAFLRCAKAKYMERWETEISKLQRLARWWKISSLKAKRYAQSFKYADRYLPPWQARLVGQRMAAKFYHWAGQEWRCLNELWGQRESSWSVLKWNREGSGAYGIPQALPGSKMGPGWLRSAFVQIKWGLRYIFTGNFGSAPFHSPCQAIAYHNVYNSY